MKLINHQSFFRLVLAASIFLGVQGLQAQTTFKLSEANQSFIVKGTSTLHDWHMESQEAKGSCVANVKSGSIEFISGSVQLTAETLKSGKKGMDKNAYNALKTDDNPQIKFQLGSFESNGAKGVIKGKLTLAGTTKEVQFEVNVTEKSSSIQLTGSTTFNLTSFNVEPPTALMGTIKTGDEVTIEFNATFQN